MKNKPNKKFDWKGAIISSFSILFKSERFKQMVQDAIIKFLGLQISGGIRGWIIKTLVKGFSKEVIYAINTGVDYVDIKHKVDETVDNEDRNDATTRLNGVMWK